MRHITTASGKSIHVFDDQVPLLVRDETYVRVKSSNFRLGWGDGSTEETIAFNYLHSMYDHDEIRSTAIYKCIMNTEAKDLVKGMNLSKAIANLSTPSDPNFTHAHPEKKVILYYVNMEWRNTGWHGETHWYDEGLANVEFTSPYTPGRFVVFDGSIPHCIRPQSYLASNYRFTLALTFD
jgi:hypothetical protein